MVEKDVFLVNPKHQYYLSQWGEWICGTQSLKDKRLLSESVFIQSKNELLILTMVERYVFLMKPNHEYHLSQWEECVYDA